MSDYYVAISPECDHELCHYGIPGMKWGVRRYQNKDGSLTQAGKKRYSEKNEDLSDLKKLSYSKIRNRINLVFEKKYRELVQSDSGKKSVSRGKQIATDILENSTKNIGGQLVTYLMGTAVNKMAGKNIVNPKKGQKDK